MSSREVAGVMRELRDMHCTAAEYPREREESQRAYRVSLTTVNGTPNHEVTPCWWGPYLSMVKMQGIMVLLVPDLIRSSLNIRFIRQ